MADTRCANPEYQLDVDVMMLEYVLYRAIQASLKALEPTSRLQRKKDSTWQNAQRVADQCVKNFDILVKLFRHNHAASVLNEGTEYNIRILEFLVLLTSWLDGVIHDNIDTSDPLKADEMSAQLQYERVVNLELRRLWLSNHKDGGTSPTSFPPSESLSPNSQFPVMRRFSLQDFMPRFLDLSAEVANCMGHVSAQWFQLAAEFMLQCAFERIEWFISVSKPESPLILNEYPQWLAQCFAWGASPNIEPSTSLARSILKSCSNPINEDTIFSTQQMLRTEQHISGIFTSKPPPTTEPSLDNTAHEEPIWTTLRKAHQSLAHDHLTHLLTKSPDSSATSISSQHPQHEFLKHLITFVDGLWYLNVGSISEKPVLVQIEEGGIKGLSDDEFAAFLRRVGLKMNHGAEGDDMQIRWIVPGEERKRMRDA